MQVRAERVQRLWLLTRGDTVSPALEDRCSFAGAITVLDGPWVYGLIVRAAEPEGASEAALGHQALRFDLQRDAHRFESLDAALAWADGAKRRWLLRGWIEVAMEGDER